MIEGYHLHNVDSIIAEYSHNTMKTTITKIINTSTIQICRKRTQNVFPFIFLYQKHKRIFSLQGKDV